jgi:Niemann-Pick C1 protein
MWLATSPCFSFLLQHYSSSEACLSAFGGPVDPTTILGGFSGNNYSQVIPFLSHHF